MTDDDPRQSKHPRLPRFREARKRKKPAQQDCTTDTSSIISFQRSSSGIFTAQERERQHQTAAEELSLPEEPSPLAAEELSATPELVTTEDTRKPKRKRVNTTKVRSLHYV